MFSELLFVLCILLVLSQFNRLRFYRPRLFLFFLCDPLATTSHSYGTIVNNNGIGEGFRCDGSKGLENCQRVNSGYLLDSTSPGREARGT